MMIQPSEKKKIFIDIPCPVSMRNIVTGSRSVYRRLVDMGYEVVLLVPDYAADAIQESFSASIEVARITSGPTKLEQASDFLTKHLNMTRMQVLGSKYGLRHNLAGHTRRAYLHGVRTIIAATLGRWRWFRVVVAPRIHLAAFGRRRPLKELFERHKPDLVFVPNMVSRQGEEVLRESRQQGVKLLGMVGSWDHPHKRFSSIQTDSVFVWSESLKQEMINLQSYCPDRVIVTGAPHFDLFLDPALHVSREEFLKDAGLAPHEELLTLFSGTGRAPDEGDIIDMLLRASAERRTTKPVQIYVRTYPGDEEGDAVKFGAFKDRTGVHIDWPGHGTHFGPAPLNYFPDEAYMRKVINLYRHSAAVLSVYSSASVEASIFEKPSINIGFDGYKERPYEESVKRFVLQSHFDKLFATGAVIDTHSEQELIDGVNAILTEPHLKQEEIRLLQHSVCGPLDGKASERIAAYIASTVSQT